VVVAAIVPPPRVAGGDLDHISVCLSRLPRPRFAERDPKPAIVRGQADRQGQAFGRPIGMVVAGALKGDIRESLNKFKSVFAPA